IFVRFPPSRLKNELLFGAMPPFPKLTIPLFALITVKLIPAGPYVCGSVAIAQLGFGPRALKVYPGGPAQTPSLSKAKIGIVALLSCKPVMVCAVLFMTPIRLSSRPLSKEVAGLG